MNFRWMEFTADTLIQMNGIYSGLRDKNEMDRLALEIKRIGFDPQQALNYAQAIAKPRLVGTQQERRTGRYIASCLGSFGYEVKTEEFRFSDVMSVLLNLEIIFSMALIILTIWLYSLGQPLYFLTSFLLIMHVFLINRTNNSVEINSITPGNEPKVRFPFGLIHPINREVKSANYVARFPSTKRDPLNRHLTLVAHYDSKSQKISLVIRIALITLAMSCALLFTVFILITPPRSIFSPAAVVSGISAIVLAVPLLFLDLGNESPGAIDNASSVGVLLHLAEVLAQYPQICRRLDLTFLFTSAEEVHTLGAQAYVHRHDAQLRQQADRDQSLVLNLDGIGVDGQLFWVGKERKSDPCNARDLICLVRQACNELDLGIKHFMLPGAAFDHIPFSNIGMDACTLVSISRKSACIHTPRDSVDKLDRRGFEVIERVIMHIIEATLDTLEPADVTGVR